VRAAGGRLNALLLAAGRGDRLRPLTDVVPKPALPLPGAPLGAWMLESLLERFDSVAVNCSHLAPEVVARLSLEGRAEVLVEEPEPFGTAGTLAGLRPRVEDRITVANADVITDLDPGELVAGHVAAGAPATVAVLPVESKADFTLSREGMVEGFIDRRDRADVAGARFIGVSVYERSALEALPDERPLGLGESLLAPLAASGRLAAYVHRGYAGDVGTVDRYAGACSDVLAGNAPPVPGGPYDDYRGRVIEVAGGRAFVAASASCEEGSLEDGAVVLAGAEVEPEARIRRSIVWPGERVPSGTALQDCIWFRGAALRVN
jgi:mannose-1-phosphate guanylyltransferase